MKIAGPLALIVLTILYVLAQVAYFAAVPIPEILESKQIIAASFFKHMFGERSARALSVFVALSAVANVFSVLFSQGRLNQALGRDSLIPFSRMFASNRPFNTPLAGLTWHMIVTLILMLAPPQGDAYNFVLNLSSYPLNVVNLAVGFGLCLSYLPRSSGLKPSWFYDWNPKFRATIPITIFFTLVSAFLVVVPWIPPTRKVDAQYTHIWYALHAGVALAFFAGGALYWCWWYVLLPRVGLHWPNWHTLRPTLGRYWLEPVETVMDDGTLRTVFERRPLDAKQSTDSEATAEPELTLRSESAN